MTTSAAVNVVVNANQAPTVSLVSPNNNALFTAPATITLTATASDTDGTIASVEFLNGANVIATLTSPPYSYDWTNVGPGGYTLTARATDDKGAQTTSGAVTVTVSAASATIYYIYPDQINTPRAITNEAATTIWKWDNVDPFGANAPNEDPDGDNNKFVFNLRFPGQYFDKETGLHYNYFRDYSPADGRYWESDPIGLGGGINTFGYVEWNPIGNRDPLGLWSTEVHNAILRAAFPGLNAALLTAIQQGSGNVDLDQSTAGAPLHAMSRMSDGKNRVEIAKREACKFIQDRLGLYNQYRNSSNPTELYAAYFALGQALHPVMDSTSPAHGWAIWNSIANPKNWSGVRQHGNGSKSLENMNALTKDLLNMTIDLINQTLNSNSCACTM